MKIHARDRRMFLQGLCGAGLALPWLPSLLKGTVARGANDKLIRYVQLIADHHPVAMCRHPDFAKGAYGSEVVGHPGGGSWGIGDPSHLNKNIDAANGIRWGELPTNLRQVGNTFDLEILRANSARLREQMNIHYGLLLPGFSIGIHCNAYGGGSPSLAAFFSSNGDGNACRNLTFDQLLYKKLFSTTQKPQIVSMRGSGITSIGGTDKKTVENGKNTPQEIYDLIFNTFTFPATAGGAPTPAPTTAPVDYDARVRGGILNFVNEDRKALANNPRLSTDDRNLLDSYYQELSDLEARLRPDLPSTGGAGGGAGVTAECRASSSVGGGDEEANARAFLSVLHLSFLCNRVNVAAGNITCFDSAVGKSLQDYYNIDALHEAVYHESHKYPRIFEMDRLYIKLVAEFADKLYDSIDPVTGERMIDTAVVLFTNEHGMARSQDIGAHNENDYSYVTFGGGKRLNTGRMYDYLDATRKPVGGSTSRGWAVNHFLKTLGSAYGVAPEDAEAYGFGSWPTKDGARIDYSGSHWNGSIRDPMRSRVGEENLLIPQLLKA